MVMKTINNIKNGNWAGLATDLASVAVSFIPGVGPVAGAALQAGIQGGSAAIQGQGLTESIKAGATGAAGSLLGGAAGGAAFKGMAEAAAKVTSKIGSKGGGSVTGAAAPIPTSAPTAASTIDMATANGLRPKANISIQDKVGGAINTVKNSKVGQVVAKAGKGAGQYVAQGALSIASAAIGTAQANAANEVSKQSLLFQKQTYNEQKAEVDKNKAKLKEEAWSDYSSASLFGSQLYGSDSNNTLLTSYHTNGTGNQGNYSIIGSGITTSKKTDLT